MVLAKEEMGVTWKASAFLMPIARARVNAIVNRWVIVFGGLDMSQVCIDGFSHSQMENLTSRMLVSCI